MAVLSDVQKYTIKHVNDTGDPVEIPCYPSSIDCSDNLISKSWNNMYGEFVDIPVNVKLKINWVFDVISKTDLNTLFYTYIRQKIITYKSRFFEVNCYFTGIGWIKSTFYLGTPTNFKSLDWQSSNGEPNWFSLELHWIEVYGDRLNDPSVSVNIT